MSDDSAFDASFIKQLGVNFPRELDPIFQAAKAKLDGAPKDLEPAAFTTFGFAFSIAHTEVFEYFEQDLKRKVETAQSFGDNLQAIAQLKSETERKSTIDKVD